MRVLISGGSGFIGSQIVEELLKSKQFDVSVLTRNPPSIRKRFSGEVSALFGDITLPSTLKDTFKSVDAVIQCAQFPNHPVQNYKKGYTYENVDAHGTENVCRALKDSSVGRIIYFSGAGTSPERREPWFLAKARAEAAVKATGKDYVILRPSWVYGPRDKSLNKFVKMARSLPFMPVIGNGENRSSPLFVGDLAKACAKALVSPEAKNQVVDIGGPEVLTMNQIQSTVLDILHLKKPLVHQPTKLMKVVGKILETLLSTPPLSSEAIDFINMDLPVDHLRAEQLFQMKFISLKDGLSSYIQLQ